MKNVPLKFTASLIADTISRSLYKDPFACLMEIIRNGLCASMPGKDWVPGTGEIEINFCQHPLAKGRVLTVLDHGHGFNERSMRLIGSLGRTMSEKEEHPDGDFGGASQKGIGRFAALGCMKAGESRRLDPNTGFYILTRDKKSGPIKLISMIPSLMEVHQGTPIEELSLTDSRLGIAAELKGTFSMVVIPNPIFTDMDDVIAGIRWRLPRKPGQMFNLTINGERVNPPPLTGRVHFESQDGEIEVHVDVEKEPDSDTGIWLTDATTGFRVVQASRLGRAHIPPPYCYNGLSGDIFVHGLLMRQNASRGGLNGDYLRGEDWKKVKASLFANRASVDALLGDKRTRDTPGEKEMGDLIEIASSVFGPPQVVIDEFDTVRKKSTTTGAGTRQSGGGARETNRKADNESGNTVTKNSPQVRRAHAVQAIRLGEHDFLIAKGRLGSHCFAEPEAGGRRENNDVVTIYINDQYGHLPSRQEAREEHVINAFLFAAACADPLLMNQALDAMAQVMRWRSQMEKAK